MFFYYFIGINILGFLMMFFDKKKATYHRYRIPEKTLFIVSVLGGSIGSYIGMYMFRHKTKHLSFVLGIPCIIVIQIICYCLMKSYFL